jgi:hypothetical protein
MPGREMRGANIEIRSSGKLTRILVFCPLSSLSYFPTRIFPMEEVIQFVTSRWCPTSCGLCLHLKAHVMSGD